jgi:2,3-bisphosphoglycerate-independent phosphoglycerate mutase
MSWMEDDDPYEGAVSLSQRAMMGATQARAVAYLDKLNPEQRQAVETLDACMGRLVEALEKVGGEALITADHGNVEQMEDVMTGQAHTAHTCEPVPFIYVGKRKASIREGGVLADVAPTMLTLLGLPVPEEMTGHSIIQLNG